MSATAVTRTVKLAGVLANVTSMTAVVTRTDTSAVVANVATHPSTGVYTFTVTDPAYDLTYHFTLTVTYAGETYTDVVTVTGAVTPGTPAPVVAGAVGYPYTLNRLAVSCLGYLGFANADADIATTGGSYSVYVEAITWVNSAVQEMADYGAWPWLKSQFAKLALSPGHTGAAATISGLTLTKAGENFTSSPVIQVGDTVTLSVVTGATVAATYIVAAVDSATQLTLTTAPGDGTATYVTAGGYLFDLPEDVHRLMGPPSYDDFPYDWEPATLEDIQILRSQSVAAQVSQVYAMGWNKVTGRQMLAIWPPCDAARTVQIQYSRILPAMTDPTDVPACPPNMHWLVLLGTEAWCEEQRNHNFASPIRQIFNQKLATEYAKSADAGNMRLSLKMHSHRSPLGQGRFGPQRLLDSMGRP